ncbi:MAG: fimbria/pilus periplasmic chaperone [Enterobacterales bacterium]|uniref:fimbria/pilus periplasmic chaperone n=1 Tax=Serratia sp. (in: enterobacteria) TaxID=616 RepID=UPI003F2BDEDB
MFNQWIKTTAAYLFFGMTMVGTANAGGVGLGATRLIYPSDTKQISISVRNTDENQAFLIQPWIEDKNGEKSNDFLVTPPLSVLKPKQENLLRIVYTGPSLAQDKETLFWLTVKAVPPQHETANNKNVLQLASANRIKIFYRPTSLTTPPQDAPELLTAKIQEQNIVLSNASEYHVTMVNLNANGQYFDAVMVPPKNSTTLKLNKPGHGVLKFKTINDYGAKTKEMTLSY